MNKNERRSSSNQETIDRAQERRDTSGQEADDSIVPKTSEQTEDTGRADSARLAQLKKRMEHLVEGNLPESSDSRGSIIRSLKERIINPAKPTFGEIFSWMTHTALGQHYDSQKAADIYDKIARHSFGREEEARDIAVALLENIQTHPKDALICERAAGTGIVTEALAAAGFRIRASDSSRSQLDKLSSRLPDVEIVQEDINGAMEGAADGTADGVLEVAADRFMTSEGQLRYVQEAYRTLKPGGMLIWPASPFEAIAKLKHGLKWKAGKRQISRLLTENGFEILSADLHLYRLNLSAITHLIIARKRKSA